MQTPQVHAAHALIGPSSFSRVIECPASGLIGAHMPRKSSAAADAGSALHDQAERMLQKFRDTGILDSFAGINEQVLAYVLYASYRIAGYSYHGIEDRVHLDSISGGVIPFFGTIDFWCFDAEHGHLEIVDLKTGSMQVSAEDNVQLSLYAIGVKDMLESEAMLGEGAVRRVTLTIHQGGYERSERISADVLDSRANRYREAFKAAISPVARFSAPGEHCRWCPGKAICPSQERQLVDALGSASMLATMTENKAPTAARMMILAQQAVDVLDAAKAIVQAEFEATGELPPGITAKAYQPPAKWIDVKEAAWMIRKLCDDAIEEGLLVPATPTVVQKKLGLLPDLVDRAEARLMVRVAK